METTELNTGSESQMTLPETTNPPAAAPALKNSRCGFIFKSQFTDPTKAFVIKADGVPDMYINANGVVWANVFSIPVIDGKLADVGRSEPTPFDTLHSSKSGETVTFRALGNNYMIKKDKYNLVNAGLERNAMVTRLPIETKTQRDVRLAKESAA